METLKKQMIEKLEGAGFSIIEDPTSDGRTWYRETTIKQPGASITINGQHVRQQDDIHKIEQEFRIYYNVDIKDVSTGVVNTSIMCWFRVWDNENLIQDVELNFYPEEFMFFENFCKKIYGI